MNNILCSCYSISQMFCENIIDHSQDATFTAAASPRCLASFTIFYHHHFSRRENLGHKIGKYNENNPHLSVKIFHLYSQVWIAILTESRSLIVTSMLQHNLLFDVWPDWAHCQKWKWSKSPLISKTEQLSDCVQMSNQTHNPICHPPFVLSMFPQFCQLTNQAPTKNLQNFLSNSCYKTGILIEMKS